MLFKKRASRPATPEARKISPHLARSEIAASDLDGLDVANGPDTPVITVSAMKRALNHAAWRDPSVDERKGDKVLRAVGTLERTAACVDLAEERLLEALETVKEGKIAREPVMRGLLTARLEELLDSLERVAMTAQDGEVNLLGGNGEAVGDPTSSYAPVRFQNSLHLEVGSAGLNYALTPIDVRRGPYALAIPVLNAAFEDDSETAVVESAIVRAIAKIKGFAQRLASDAAMLVTLAHTDCQAPAKTNREDAA